MPQDLVQVSTLVIAVLGAVLGVINTWRAMSKDTPRVSVRAMWHGTRMEGSSTLYVITRRSDALQKFPDGYLSVQAINTGYVPVFISEAGVCPWCLHWFQWLREFKEPAGRGAIVQDKSGKITLPYKLEPGASVDIALSKAAMNSPPIGRAGLVYVMTSDERLFTGGHRLVRAVAKRQRAAATKA